MLLRVDVITHGTVPAGGPVCGLLREIVRLCPVRKLLSPLVKPCPKVGTMPGSAASILTSKPETQHSSCPYMKPLHITCWHMLCSLVP
jgi:hypothetical protein